MQLLNYSIQVARKLLQQHQKSKEGIFWRDFEETPDYPKAAFLCANNVDVCLFFIELYKHTYDELDLEVAQGIAHYLIAHCTKNNVQEDYSIANGQGKFILVLCQLYDLTDKRGYLKSALSIAYKCDVFLNQSNYNFAQGICGTLIALLHLHQMSEVPRLLPIIDRYLQRIMSQLQIGPKGLFLKEDGQTGLKPICGFGKGLSGIAFTLLEVGFYFQNDSYYWLAEQLLATEDKYYKLNFDKGSFLSSFFNKSKKDDKSKQITWEMLLSRLRAYNLLDKKRYIDDVRKLLKKVVESKEKSHIVFSKEEIGKIDICLEVDRLLVNNNVKYLITTFENELLSQDSAVLSPNLLAKGWLALRLADSNITSSKIAPRLAIESTLVTDGNAFPFITMLQPELDKRLIQKIFPKTLYALEHYLPDQIINFLMKEHHNLVGDFIHFYQKNIKYLTLSQKAEVAAFFEKENNIFLNS